MPVTNQPTDQPYGQIITDERTLERLFRTNYTKWVADAKRRLGDDAAAAAPRVVSKAFHLAWQDRKRFQSQDELDAFLGANIQHQSARELSRRASAHRFGSHGAEGEHKGGGEHHHDQAEMTVDEAWDRLHHTLQGASAPEAQRARASMARHDAAEHMAGLAKERNWKPMAAIGVAGLLIASGAVWWINKAGESRAVDHALAAGDTRRYETSYGQQVNVTLDDGTVVRLGPESQLTIPKKFGLTGGFRAVRIDGTANFNVTQQQKLPFEVRNGGVAITATGTEFTVRRYKDDARLIVFVKQGTVNVRSGEQVRPVREGTALQVAQDGAMAVPGTEDLDEARTWADGNVTIVGHDLRYVLPQLKRWYGLDIHVEDQALLARKVFVRAAVNSPKEAITSVEQSGGLKFTYIGENMAFKDTVPGARTKAPATKTGATKRR
jgi:ferric-dicitrate binding protein FerR (iron transport regulator)